MNNKVKPIFEKGDRVRILVAVGYMDNDDNEHISEPPTLATVSAVDIRENVVIYDLHLDGGGYWLHEANADGNVVEKV